VQLAYQVSDGTAPPIDASQSFEIVLPSDDGGEEPPVSVIKGTPEADNLPGTDGNDVFKPIEGDDDVFGGDGDDSVILPGDADGYVFVQLANGQVGVVDSDPSDGDQGSDVLDGIELIRFGDENGTDTPLASLIDMEQPAWTLESVEVGLVAATWQLFMQMAPSEAGFEYLILSDVNPHDLTDPYYARFNAENKYINFTTNMATGNPTGAAWFEREFGNLSYEEAVEKAFNLIITEDALLAAGGDPEASKQFFLDAKGFYAQVAAERIVPGGVDLAYATNITLLSSVLFAAVLADVGPYGAAVNDFVDQVVRVGTSNEFLHDLLAA
jgi:Ca2+-binding RTX toxin-like protein